MNRRTSTIVSIIGIIIVLLALLGITYGYYVSQINGNESSKSVEVVTGNSSVRYTDLSEENISEIIEPGYSTTKTFTVENTGNISATYSIFFVDVYNDFVRTEDVVYTLYRIDNSSSFPTNYEGCIENPTDEKNCKIVVNNVEFPTTVALIKANEIITEPGDIFKYDLVITYINQPTINQNVDQGHTFRASVNLRGDSAELDNPFGEGTLAYSILNNSINNLNGTEFKETPYSQVAKEYSGGIGGTGEIAIDLAAFAELHLYDNLDDAINYGPTAGTTVEECKDDYIEKYVFMNGYNWETYGPIKGCEGKKYKIADEKQEKVLSITQDDYGTSYYYRGGVTDNYVNFSGMCWRIVRIEGDGSVKLILQDKNTTCNDFETTNTPEEYTADWLIGTGFYGADLLDMTTSTGITFMEEYPNYFTSQEGSMNNKFETWFDNENIDTSKLKLDKWCLGEVDEAYNSDGEKYSLVDLLYVSPTSMYFDTYRRLFGVEQERNATLKCELNGYKSFESYVATLTADEIIYTGEKAGESGFRFNNYLLDRDWNNNAFASVTLSLSYGGFVFYYDDMGALVEQGISYNFPANLRPAITLKNGTKISGGNGTQNEPYVVN